MRCIEVSHWTPQTTSKHDLPTCSFGNATNALERYHPYTIRYDTLLTNPPIHRDGSSKLLDRGDGATPLPLPLLIPLEMELAIVALLSPDKSVLLLKPPLVSSFSLLRVDLSSLLVCLRMEEDAVEDECDLYP